MTTPPIAEQLSRQKWKKTGDHYTIVAAGLIAVLRKSHGYIAKASDYTGKFDDSTSVKDITYQSFRGVYSRVLAALEAKVGEDQQLTDEAFKLAQWKRGRNPRAKKRPPKPRVELNWSGDWWESCAEHEGKHAVIKCMECANDVERAAGIHVPTSFNIWIISKHDAMGLDGDYSIYDFTEVEYGLRSHEAAAKWVEERIANWHVADEVDVDIRNQSGWNSGRLWGGVRTDI